MPWREFGDDIRRSDRARACLPSPVCVWLRSRRQPSNPSGWLVETGEAGRDANNGTARRHDIHALASHRCPAGIEVRHLHLRGARATADHRDRDARTACEFGSVDHAARWRRPTSSSSARPARMVRPTSRHLPPSRFPAAQGMIYRRGLWHHPIMAIGADARFLVQSWQDGSTADCEILAIEARTLAPGRLSPTRPRQTRHHLRQDGDDLREHRDQPPAAASARRNKESPPSSPRGYPCP
jgi:ureidoglycolate lyase